MIIFMGLPVIYKDIEIAEQEIENKKTLDAKEALKNLRSKYGI